MELYKSSPKEFGKQPTRTLNRGDFEDNPEFEVECILGDRLSKAQRGRKICLYRVRYTGYGAEYDKWHSAKNL